jgi:LysM repeat protein
MLRNSPDTPILKLLLLLAAVASIAVPALGEPSARMTDQESEELPLISAEELSPSFLGMYRKVMLIEKNIAAYSRKYEVDLSLARAVCMYESGGNANLRSHAGARGYFQVMPATFRSLRVRSNIEAGVKYLGQLAKQFNREEHILAAYNGGPTRVARGRIMPLETRQYVMGVADYRAVLEKYGPLVRKSAEQLGIETVRPGDNWWRLSRRLGLPLVQLRLYNPFLAARTLKPGYHVVYPFEPRLGILEAGDDDTLYYRSRLGDNLISLAFALGVDLGTLRKTNGILPLQSLTPGTMLEIPLAASATFTTYRVARGDSILKIAERLHVDPWSIVRDNLLWNQTVETGMVLRIRRPPRPKYLVYRVRRGDNLGSIARHYRTTVRALQRNNSMGRRTRIRIGQRIRIPAR